MKKIRKALFLAALLSGGLSQASAQGIERIYGANPASPIASGTVVPSGFTTYYLSGALPTPIMSAANGQPAVYGDITQQTRSTLDNLKAVMDKMGIGYSDVVSARVYLDPKAEFQAMNRVWATEFGTTAQPHKPARATVFVQALVVPGALVEIEFIAARKP